MKYPLICFILHGLLFAVLASNEGGKEFCSWNTKINGCLASEFRCLNKEKCISRELYCNYMDDCGDNSDEKYCSATVCPESYLKCEYEDINYYSSRCVPNEWMCNGYDDCYNRKDETNCSKTSWNPKQNQNALEKVARWVTKQRNEETNPSQKWGNSVDSLAMILFHADRKFNTSKPREAEMTNELTIQLLSRLLSTKLSDIPSTDLASYINAFLVMCINPRDFYGYDFVQELRNRVDRENFTNPYVFLALCNAGETITESDTKKLIDTFDNKEQLFWTGTQAVVVMALACANKQQENEENTEKLLEMTWKLKQQQHANDTVVDLPTTALVMQALISTDFENDPEKFDQMKVFKQLVKNQKSDGSFGDEMSTFLVTSIITCRSLLDINSDHCKNNGHSKYLALENLFRGNDPTTRVQYSLWIGEKKNLERNLVLRVPQNASLYDVMERAAEIDSRFNFEYSVKNNKPYIKAISGKINNPLRGKFWFLYLNQNGQATPSDESPVDIIPNEDEHYVMWYRKGTWAD